MIHLCVGEQNYYSSKFMFPEGSTLLDIEYPLEGSPVKEKWWLQCRGHVEHRMAAPS